VFYIVQMPVVTRSDCTQIDISTETVEFNFATGEGIKATINDLEIEFNSCQGANNVNNDLAAYYERLVNEGKALKVEKEKFDKHVVGKTYCREAIDEFLEDRGFVAKPACIGLDKYNCGCKAVGYADYRGTLSTTASGKTCQRWDAQSPHSHSYTRENYENANLIENYCRNPDGEAGWCYTNDPNTRWEYCDIPTCGEVSPAPTSSPPLVGIGLDKNLWTRTDLDSNWVIVPNSGMMTGVTGMNDGSLVGIGLENNLYTRAHLNSNWVLVQNSCCVQAITAMDNDSLVGVGLDNNLYTRTDLESNWVIVPNSGTVTRVAAMNDGSLVGIGLGMNLWTRANINSDWIYVHNSCCMIDITVMDDDSLVGVGTDNNLHTRSNLESNWVLVPNSGMVIGVTKTM